MTALQMAKTEMLAIARTREKAVAALESQIRGKEERVVPMGLHRQIVQTTEWNENGTGTAEETEEKGKGIEGKENETEIEEKGKGNEEIEKETETEEREIENEEIKIENEEIKIERGRENESIEIAVNTESIVIVNENESIIENAKTGPPNTIMQEDLLVEREEIGINGQGQMLHTLQRTAAVKPSGRHRCRTPMIDQNHNVRMTPQSRTHHESCPRQLEENAVVNLPVDQNQQWIQDHLWIQDPPPVKMTWSKVIDAEHPEVEGG